eukprot:gene7706-7905_t
MPVLVIALALVYGTFEACALDNGLGRTPPMGFNTWNYFGCDINEGLVRTAANKLIALGLAEAGYKYLNIDDCWHQHARDHQGQLQADPFKFPSGIKALADDIHGLGLLFGIYSDSGLLTCAGFPGSRFHEADDAALFAAWGVDYLKQANLLQHVWRTDADITPAWDGILRSLDNGAAGLGKYAGQGGWNDPDMLEVGNGHLTVQQQRSHFALWALIKAPLLIGTNLAAVSQQSLAILKAREVIAINQDPLGVAGDIIWKEGPAEIWAAPLAGGERAVILFNRHWTGNPLHMTVTWAQLGFPGADKPGFKAAVRDLYAEQDLGVFADGFAADVDNNDVAVLRVKPAIGPAALAVNAGNGVGPCSKELRSRMVRKIEMIREVPTRQDRSWFRDVVLRKAFNFLSNTTADQEYLENIRNDKIAGIPAGARVVCVEYRLAPEHPFPAGLSDAFAVYQELVGSAMGYKPENIAIAGDSAGGGMVFALLMMIQQRNLPMPGAAGALSPWTDLAASTDTVLTLSSFDLYTGPAMASFSGGSNSSSVTTDGMSLAYVAGNRSLLYNPLVSPLRADFNASSGVRLPPILIQVGLRESLLGNAALMFRKLRAGGQCAFFSPWVGMWHVFQTSAASGAPEAVEAQQEMGQFFARHLGKPTSRASRIDGTSIAQSDPGTAKAGKIAASSATAESVENVCCW